MKALFLDIEGIRTRILCAGAGPAVFLLHGVGFSASAFFRNLDEIGNGHAVYAPDMLGHGYTDAVDFGEDSPQRAAARHVRMLADHLGIERYSVVGSSHGALVAALMWFDRPERVDKLLLIGSGAVFHPAAEQEATLRDAAANAAKAMAAPTLDSCRRRMEAICHDPRSVPTEILLDQLTAYALPGRFDAYKATISRLIATCSSEEHRVYTRLERLSAPTLIVVGREDVRAKWQLHAEGRRRMPNARLSIMEKCGHLPYLERADAFNGLACAFLAGESVGD